MSARDRRVQTWAHGGTLPDAGQNLASPIPAGAPLPPAPANLALDPPITLASASAVPDAGRGPGPAPGIAQPQAPAQPPVAAGQPGPASDLTDANQPVRPPAPIATPAAAVSGLNAQSQAMGMISDNVSNVNTVSYNAAEAQFWTLVTRSAASATYSPGGVRANTLYRITEHGLIQASSSPTDVAIDGSGFFVVNSRIDGRGEQLYARAGSFEQGLPRQPGERCGLLSAGLGARRQRADRQHQPGRHGQRAGHQRPRRRDHRRRARGQSGRDPAPFAGAYIAGDMADFAASGGISGVQPHMVRSVQVFDSLGGAHNVQVAFLKDPAANTWSAEIYADSAEVETGDHPNGLLASGTITFNGDGTLASTSITPNYPAAVVGARIGINWLDLSGPAAARSRSTSARSTAPTGSASSPPTTTSRRRRGRRSERRHDRRRGASSSPPSPTARPRGSTACRSRPSPIRWRSIRGPATSSPRPRRRASSICAARVRASPAPCRRRRWRRSMSIWPTSLPK